MNNNHDVYMCRVQPDGLDEALKRIRLLTANPSDLLSIKPATLHFSGSPFDRMPSKIEMDGMMAIFKREYCFGDEDE